jgi:hypothetical protein
MISKITFIFLIFITFFSVSAQENIDFIQDEDSLVSGFEILFTNNGTKYTLSDSEKDTVNNQILTYFYKVLSQENSFEYSFDSLKKIGNIYSEDKTLRIITWNIKYKDGSYKYFGFIQHYNKKQNKYELWKLYDDSENMLEPLKLSLYNHHWLGCLYYQIIENKYNNEKIYTLIGWDGNNYLSKKKIIDVLYFSNNGSPNFGKNIFKINKTKSKRLIFEYSSEVVMFMKYEDRYNKIVFDHLTPSPKSMVDKHEFYYPDGTYDALEYVGNRWIHISDFYATNKRDKDFEKDLEKKPEINKSDGFYRPK